MTSFPVDNADISIMDDLSVQDLNEWLDVIDEDSAENFMKIETSSNETRQAGVIASDQRLSENKVQMSLDLEDACMHSATHAISNGHSWSSTTSVPNFATTFPVNNDIDFGERSYQDQYAEAYKNLELLMQRSAQSRQEIMHLRSALPNQPPKALSIFDRVDGLLSGKSLSLTKELEHSRNQLKEFSSRSQCVSHSQASFMSTKAAKMA